MRAMTEIEWLDGRVTKVPELALGDALGESVQAELDFGFDDVLEGLWVEVRHHKQDEDGIRDAVGGIHHEPGVQQVWAVFGDDQMAAALIDRIVHHGRLVQFRGESYRVRHALMQEG